MANTYHPRGVLIHGFRPREHPLYYTWVSMKARCDNSKLPGYENYGGRGIAYCERWAHFANFAEDMGPDKPFPEATIERKNNDLGYSPSNCKWATRTEQALNRRRFKSNTSGATGIRPDGTGFNARFDHSGVRYNLGIFDTFDAALAAREKFIQAFEAGDPGAYDLINAGHRDPTKAHVRQLRRDSSTGVTGITSTRSGFVVRKTVERQRLYLGHATTFSDAVRLLRAHD